jgi:hypothetical protein
VLHKRTRSNNLTYHNTDNFTERGPPSGTIQIVQLNHKRQPFYETQESPPLVCTETEEPSPTSTFFHLKTNFNIILSSTPLFGALSSFQSKSMNISPSNVILPSPSRCSKWTPSSTVCTYFLFPHPSYKSALLQALKCLHVSVLDEL